MSVKSAVKEGAVTPAGSVSNQDGTPASLLLRSDRPLPSFALKAAAVLEEELKTTTRVTTEVFGKAISSAGPLGIEPAAERFRQEARKLVDSFIELLEHRPEHMS